MSAFHLLSSQETSRGQVSIGNAVLFPHGQGGHYPTSYGL